ncbi:DprA-like DNA recombination-mediator protein [Aeromonas phage PX29]|uniref:Uncharacterized protein n=1 Tax=Aeromonas phage PX29 TaxID=926067 RepID=E5DQF7_9CAUD|nr:DprA-like DNA recombination-mediator protein [Aeromonas phage PX29]ADQ52943.1 conserved hypothetical protein [Aeromonas phage PX29]
MKKIATLVGTRFPPSQIAGIASKIGRNLSDKGFIGRSGGAIGMDQAWLSDYDPSLCEIYRPDDKGINVLNFDNFFEAEEMVKRIIPHFEYLDFYSQWLHTRNAYQVLGRDLNTPSDFLLCYAPVRNKVVQGGTRTAFVLARRNGIPVYNLYDPEHLKKWCDKFQIEVEVSSNKQIDLSFLE